MIHNDNLGLEESSKFYFQQRRGNLDIRSLSRLNIDNIIKTTDVDALQSVLENIAFSNLDDSNLKYLTDPLILKLFRVSQLIIEYLLFVQDRLVGNLSNLAKRYANKKRDLLKKRRELSILQESVNHLNRQVNLKRENIRTLENLLKDTTKTRKNMKIITNRKDSMNDSDKDERHTIKDDLYNISAKLYNNSIQTQTSPKSQSTAVQADLLKEEGLNDKNISSFVENKRSDADLFFYFSEKWNKLETTLRGEIDHQMSLHERKIQASVFENQKQRLLFGDLEDDETKPAILPVKETESNRTNDTASEELKALRQEMISTNSAISSLQQMVLDRNNELSLLQAELAKRERLIDLLREENRKKSDSMKLSEVIVRNEINRVDITERIDKIESPARDSLTPEEKKSDVILKEQDVNPIEIKNESSEDIEVRMINESVIVPIEDDTDIPEIPQAIANMSIPNEVNDDDNKTMNEPISIQFAAAFNQDLATFSMEFLDVKIPREFAVKMTVDDIVFELRKSIAAQVRTPRFKKSLLTCISKQTSVPFARVALLFDEQVVTLGMDLGDLTLSVEDAALLAKEGVLRLHIQSGDVITDFQLDSIVEAWEKQHSNTLQSSLTNSDSIDDSKKWSSLLRSVDGGLTYTDSMDLSLMRNKQHHTAIQDESKENHDYELISPTERRLNAHRDSLRSSLDEVMYESIQKGGMTDEELENKISALQLMRNSLPLSLSNDLERINRVKRAQLSGSALEDIDADEIDDSMVSEFTVKISANQRDALKASRMASASLIKRHAKLYDENDEEVGNKTLDQPSLPHARNQDAKHGDSDDDMAPLKKAPRLNDRQPNRYSATSDEEESDFDQTFATDKILSKFNHVADEKQRSAKESSVEYLERKLSGIPDEPESINVDSTLDNVADRKTADSNVTYVSSVHDESSFDHSKGTIPTLRGDSTFDFSKTIDSNGDMIPIPGSPIKQDDVQRLVKEYEREAALKLLNSSSSTLTGLESTVTHPVKSTVSIASPFQTLNEFSDTIDSSKVNSLALSESIVEEFSLSP